MGYFILGAITLVLIIYFIYDSVRNHAHDEDLSDDDIRRLYEGDADIQYPNDIKVINAKLSTEISEEGINNDMDIYKDESEDEEEELKK